MNNEETEATISPEAIEAVQKVAQECVVAFQEAYNLIVEFVEAIIEAVQQIAINLSRFFLKLQLLEWKIPNRVAEFISHYIYWKISMKFGFRWLRNKLII